MGRILCLDYGTKRTGIAVTDPMKIIATALQGISTHELEKFLINYIKQESVEKLVIGWPTQSDGSPSENARHVEAFVNRFKKLFPQIPVVLQDEYGTSKLAMESMIAGGMKKKNRRDKIQVDITSAVIILQAYLAEK